MSYKNHGKHKKKNINFVLSLRNSSHFQIVPWRANDRPALSWEPMTSSRERMISASDLVMKHGKIYGAWIMNDMAIFHEMIWFL